MPFCTVIRMDEPIAWRVIAESPLGRMKVRERRLDEGDLCDSRPPLRCKMLFSATRQPTFALAA